MTPTVNTDGRGVPQPQPESDPLPSLDPPALPGQGSHGDRGRAGNTLSTEEQTQGVAEKRWEMQTPENVQMPCLVPPGIGGAVTEQRLRAELQVAFPDKGNPILYQL